MTLTRRSLLAMAAAPALSRPAWAAPARRVAALDWGLAASAIAIGAPPAGVAECQLYDRWVSAPALPPGTVELGLRTAPSLETIAGLKPDLILTNGLDTAIRPRLESIAPTYDNAIFTAERAPLARALATTLDLGGRLGREEAARALAAEAEGRFAAAAARLSGRAPTAVLPLAFADGRHLRLYGRGSLIGDVMGRLGLAKAWDGATNMWGFALAPIEALAAVRDSVLLVLTPVPAQASGARSEGSLWSALATANRNEVKELPPVWSFGDLTAALRYGDLLADLLTTTKGAPA